MSITNILSDRLKQTDEIMQKTLVETQQLMNEAKIIHDNTTSQIKMLSAKKTLTDKEKQEYAELKIARMEAEKAYYMLKNILKSDGQKNI